MVDVEVAGTLNLARAATAPGVAGDYAGCQDGGRLPPPPPPSSPEPDDAQGGPTGSGLLVNDFIKVLGPSYRPNTAPERGFKGGNGSTLKWDDGWGSRLLAESVTPTPKLGLNDSISGSPARPSTGPLSIAQARDISEQVLHSLVPPRPYTSDASTMSRERMSSKAASSRRSYSPSRSLTLRQSAMSSQSSRPTRGNVKPRSSVQARAGGPPRTLHRRSTAGITPRAANPHKLAYGKSTSTMFSSQGLHTSSLMSNRSEVMAKAACERINLIKALSPSAATRNSTKGAIKDEELAVGLSIEKPKSSVGNSISASETVVGGVIKTKVEAKRFEAELCSFQELINVESNPTPVAEAVERLRRVTAGPNFVWDRTPDGGGIYGASVAFTFEHILWYNNCDNADLRTRTNCSITFLHKPGCAYIMQPTLPATAMVISPRRAFLPMFEMDPRSFHTFKLAWKNFLDFGVSDYRLIVGDQLDRWTARCKAVIEKPVNVVYWLMLMVGSYYRETLVQRGLLEPVEETSDHVGIVCVDSFVALSALLFAPERQVLYAGTDPTPAYLSWLQYIGDQNSSRKDMRRRHRRPSTVFESNEFMDLGVIIVYYGRIQRKSNSTSSPTLWVGNPNMVKSFMQKYAEDISCTCQIEQAVRLYTYSCSLGKYQPAQAPEDKDDKEEHWYAWNGLRICEIGVPMPSTHPTFLSPFTAARHVALLCPVHGPEAVRRAAEKKKQAEQREKERKEKELQEAIGRGEDNNPPIAASRANSPGGDRRSSRRHKTGVSMDRSRSSSFSRTSLFSDPAIAESRIGSTENSDDSDDDDDDDVKSVDSGRSCRSTASRFTVRGGPGGASQERSEAKKVCSCLRFMKISEDDKQAKGSKKKKAAAAQAPSQAQQMQEEIDEAMRSIGEYDELHCMAAVLAGGLNLSKHIVRMHFSIDPKAYLNLPLPGRITWQEALLPWYNEFHRPDIHGRSRYSMLLERTLRGLVGDGFTSGLFLEALDILRGSSLENLHEGDGLSAAGSPPRFSTMDGGVGPARKAFGLSERKPMGNSLLPQGADGRVERLDSDKSHSQTHELGLDHKRDKNIKGVVAEIVLWTELYESESIYSNKMHFETFTQWCTSASLIPFLQRCYRRFGIAGLLQGQTSGGHKNGTDPSHPLVLPTVADFCYGHCYPFHRVLQYFYSGMEQIMCSVDDPKVVEADKAALELIPGQERLNNQCWFQAPHLEASQLEGGLESSSRDDVSVNLLQQLEDYVLKMGSGAGREDPFSKNRPSMMGSGLGGMNNSLERMKGPLARKQNEVANLSVLGGGSTLSAASSKGGNALRAGKRGTAMTLAGAAKQNPKGRQAKRPPARPGQLGALDPFFWFCQHNFALFTFPAGGIPRHIMSDGLSLTYRYSDFVSRTGTPERERRDHRGADDSIEGVPRHVGDDPHKSQFRIGAPPPPSINLCQPTELSAHARDRWEVRKEFVDERGLILGDSGWFPGALGYRFTFEAKTSDCSPYVSRSLVPQAQLLFMEHVRLPTYSKEERLRSRAAAAAAGRASPGHNYDHHSDGDSDHGSDAGDGRRRHGQSVQSKATEGALRAMQNWGGPASGEKPPEGLGTEVMLPPLLPAKVC